MSEQVSVRRRCEGRVADGMHPPHARARAKEAGRDAALPTPRGRRRRRPHFAASLRTAESRASSVLRAGNGPRVRDGPENVRTETDHPRVGPLGVRTELERRDAGAGRQMGERWLSR